jgi:hypothetical protein
VPLAETGTKVKSTDVQAFRKVASSAPVCRHDDPQIFQIAAVIAALVQPPPAPPPADELVAIANVGIDRGALNRLIKRGLLPAARIGRSIYVKRSDLVALVDKLAAPPPTDAPPPADDYEAAVALFAKRRSR